MKKVKDFREQREFRHKVKMLPDWKKIIEYAHPDVLYEKYTRLDDCLMEAFKWDETPEGHEYWQRVYDSIETMPMQKCCNKWMRTSDTSHRYRCTKCKRTIQ